MPTNDTQDYIPVVKLTEAELRQFRISAPRALALRGTGFFVEQITCIGQLIVTGGIALAGVTAFNWSANSLVVFLFAGIWIAIISDVLTYAVLRNAAKVEARRQQEYRRVWLVVDALRKHREEGRAVIARYPPGVGLFIDVALGSLSTVALVLELLHWHPQALYLPFQNLSFVLSLVSLVAFELTRTVWIVMHHRFGSGRDCPVLIIAGMRGVGLFLLLVATVSIGQFSGATPEEQVSARTIVLVANAWFILLGIAYSLNLIRLLRQTAWLRKHSASIPKRRTS